MSNALIPLFEWACFAWWIVSNVSEKQGTHTLDDRFDFDFAFDFGVAALGGGIDFAGTAGTS